MRLWFFLLLTVTLTGCMRRDLHLEPGPRHPVGDATVAVAPPVLLGDIPGAVTVDPFRDGLYVGNLVMSGGYRVVEDEKGMQVRSENVERRAQETYTETVVGWLDQVVAEHVVSRGIQWVAADDVTAEVLPAPRRHHRRGSHPDDGRDNVSLPRFSLQPVPLEEAALAQLPEGAELVLVPKVVHYYSHNAGWFHGQRWGTGSGARLRVLWTLYDAGDGRPLAWSDVGARRIENLMSSPSSADLEDFLIEVEEATAGLLRRTLPR